MRQMFNLFACAAAMVVIGAPAAFAEPLNFTLSGSRDATFQLDSNPTPTSSSSSFIGDQIFFNAVEGVFGGVSGPADISFGSGPFLADFNINVPSLGFTQFAGPTIFGGTTTSPTFSVGTYDLTSIVSGSSTLVISEAVSAAPEPSAWMLLIAGVGVTGAALRYRRRRTVLSPSTVSPPLSD